MSRYKGWSQAAAGTRESVEKIMPIAGDPVLIDKNPPCPKCNGKLWKYESRKDNTRVILRCQDCKREFTTTKLIIQESRSIKLWPDKADPPWIYKEMKPVMDKIMGGNEYNPNEASRKLCADDIREWLTGAPGSQQEEIDQIDDAINRIIPDDVKKEILRHVLYAAMRYNDPYYERFISACERKHEAIRTSLVNTGRKAKRNNKISAKTQSNGNLVNT